MAALLDKNVTFRFHIKGEIDELLRKEGLACAETQESVAEVAGKISNYKEEGISLFPSVYFCDDIKGLVKRLPGSEVLQIGSGPLNAATALKALKECAPLAVHQWSIFIHREENQFAYGVFTSTNLPMSITPSEILTEDADANIFVLEVRKIAESCVEIRGGKKNRIRLFFSADGAESTSPEAEILRLANLVSLDVEEACRQETERFMFRTLSELLPSAHGALIAVVPKRKSALPDRLSDAIILDSPIDIASRVLGFMQNKDAESLTRLQATEDILRGMLGSDGILLLKSNCSIMGYRAFLRPAKATTPGTPSGGARRRAFEGLKEFMDKPFSCVFFRSQDGQSEIREKEDG